VRCRAATGRPRRQRAQRREYRFAPTACYILPQRHARSRPDALHNVCRFGVRIFSDTVFTIVNGLGGNRVAMALKLDVLAVFAAMIFVGAILLGAF
jgi:hypothetical protein